MFRKYGVTVVCGNGIGKTNAAIGKGITALADGKTVTLIQFLKGKANSDLMQVLKKLEPEMKAFSFEKYEGLFAMGDPPFQSAYRTTSRTMCQKH